MDRSPLLLCLLLILSGVIPGTALASPDPIPVDTLSKNQGKPHVLKEWLFWNKDMPREELMDRREKAQRVELPITPKQLQEDPKGVGWLAKSVYVPKEMAGEFFEVEIFQWGASELYFDGRECGALGGVGTTPAGEERRTGQSSVNHRLRFDSSGHYLLHVHFSDQTWQKEKDSRRKPLYGLEHFVLMPSSARLPSQVTKLIDIGTLSGLNGLLFALGFVHLLLFLFDRSVISNLYYTVFIWSFAVIILAVIILNVTDDPVQYLGWKTSIGYLVYLVLFSMLTLFHGLLSNRNFGPFFKGTVLIGLTLLLLGKTLMQGYSTVFAISFTFLVLVECFRIVIRSLIRKEKGTWIPAIGMGLFVLIPLVKIVYGVIMATGIRYDLNTFIAYSWLCSIPFSMSIYLARYFAMLRMNLREKLQEVRELSEKNLQQEREKQEILQRKKVELEEKVEERTRELREQKELVEEKQEETARQKEKLEEAHKEIKDSINYAQRIQEAVLPEGERYAPLPEHFILFQPRDPVSGDFHWGKTEGSHFYLAAVDCTGHGVPGGFMSMLGISFLNEIMAGHTDLLPGEVLTKLKKRVTKELASGQETRAKDGMDMALLRIDLEENGAEREVSFAGAQNPLYLVRSGIVEEAPAFEVLRGGEFVEEKVSKAFRDRTDGLELQGDKAGIGAEEHGVEHFRTVRFRARKGDALYVFSDGYADQFGGPKGKKFRYGPFKRSLAELKDRSLEEQKQELEKEFEKWKGDQEQIDDVLVMGVRL